jgi:hypothetical protein
MLRRETTAQACVLALSGSKLTTGRGERAKHISDSCYESSSLLEYEPPGSLYSLCKTPFFNFDAGCFPEIASIKELDSAQIGDIIGLR